MERRFVPNREVRVAGGDGKPTIISGYGAVFYDGTPETEYVLWDDRYGRAVERILPGAFDAVLAKPDDVRGLFNHDANMVLGRNKAGTMRLGVDSVGLEYQIEAGDTQIARDVMQHISRGDVNGSSFSFSLQSDGQVWTITGESDGKTNELREIKAVSVLYDVGPVTFPAYVVLRRAPAIPRNWLRRGPLETLGTRRIRRTDTILRSVSKPLGQRILIFPLTRCELVSRIPA